MKTQSVLVAAVLVLSLLLNAVLVRQLHQSRTRLAIAQQQLLPSSKENMLTVPSGQHQDGGGAEQVSRDDRAKKVTLISKENQTVAGTVIIPTTALRYMRVGALEDDFRVSAAFQEISGITAAHQTELSRLTQRSAAQLRDLQAKGTQLTSVDAEHAELKYTPDIQAVDEVRQQLYASAGTILNEEEMEVFRSLVGEELDRRFNSFGSAEVSYAITKRLAPNGQYVYDVASNEGMIADPTKPRVQMLNSYSKDELLSKVPGAAKIAFAN